VDRLGVDILAYDRPDYTAEVLASSFSNETFGLRYDVPDVDPHNGTEILTTKYAQIMYIGVPIYRPGELQWLRNRTAKGTSGNISIGAYDIFRRQVFISNCQLYNTTFDLDIAVVNRKSTIHVRRRGEPVLLNLEDIYWNYEDRASGTRNSGWHVATKAWLDLMYDKVLGFSMLGSVLVNDWVLATSQTIFNTSMEWTQYRDSRLLPEQDWDRTAKPNVADLLQQLSLNFSLSLMSEERFW
jgi:hypothetical protein